MTRRELLLSSATAPLARAASTRRPNIVFVLSDDQGYGDLSLHGNRWLKTPNLDRIAQEGVQFTDYHVNPVCSPTRSCLLTGRYYYRTGVVDTYLGRSMMYPDEVTLAEILKGAGYRTGIFGKWHLGDHYPMRAMDQGFEEALVHEGGGIAQPSDPPEGNSYFNPKLMHNGKRVQRSGYCTDVFFGAALEFMEANRDRPFFVWLATNAPHEPLQVDESYIAPFRGKDLDEKTARIYGMVTNLDENMARLLGSLKRLGIEEDTILIFMTDNGPQQKRYNAGMRGLKGTVYQGGIRVPFFLRWPRAVKTGSNVDRLAAHIDITPTLLEACGVPRPAGIKLDGESLLPLIRNPAADWKDRTVYFQWHRGDRPELYRSCAARSQRYKLINGKELYDLRNDPGEQSDVSRSHPEIVSRMRAGYEEWFRDVSAPRNYQPPRIYVGTRFENPVMLTRQDWRGPRASWEERGLGHWEVDVREAGDYEAKLTFPAAPAVGRVTASMAGAQGSAPIAKGDTEARIRLPRAAKGPARFEAAVETGGLPAGVHYAEVGYVPQ